MEMLYFKKKGKILNRSEIVSAVVGSQKETSNSSIAISSLKPHAMKINIEKRNQIISA